MKSLKNNPITHQPDFARTMITGLSVRCPLQQSRAGCPLQDMRDLHPQDRLLRIREMSDEDAIQIYQNHLGCLEGRCLPQTPEAVPEP